MGGGREHRPARGHRCAAPAGEAVDAGPAGGQAPPPGQAQGPFIWNAILTPQEFHSFQTLEPWLHEKTRKMGWPILWMSVSARRRWSLLLFSLWAFQNPGARLGRDHFWRKGQNPVKTVAFLYCTGNHKLFGSSLARLSGPVGATDIRTPSPLQPGGPARTFASCTYFK